VQTGGRALRCSLVCLPCFYLLLSSFVFSSFLFARQAQSSRRIPERSPASTATLQGLIRDLSGRAIPGVQLDLHSTITGQHYSAMTDAEGIFRLRDVRLGVYEVKLVREGFQTKIIPRFELSKPELIVLEQELQASDDNVPSRRVSIGGSGNLMHSHCAFQFRNALSRSPKFRFSNSACPVTRTHPALFRQFLAQP
jgi:hypothetical protein